MKLGSWMVGAAAIVLAAGCNRMQPPMTDADRAALADSVSQVVTQTFASLAQDAAVEKVLSYFVKGNELVSAANGMIFPTYDSLVKVENAEYRPGTKLDVKFDQKHLTVLDRDVVVFAAILNGVMKDSAGTAWPVHAAWTAVYHRTSDGWKIAADHSSVAAPMPAAPAKPRRRAR
jgi:ketosteroid isomerase-like protein